MNQNDQSRLMFQAFASGIAGAAKVLCDRGIINIKPRVQPEGSDPANPHYYTGDYVAESIMLAADTAFSIIESMDPANQIPELDITKQ